MATDFRLEERIASVRPTRLAPGLELEIEGRRVAAALEPGSERGEFFVVLDGRHERVFVASRHDAHYIHWRGRTHRVDALNALDRAREQSGRAAGAEEIRAPMPGVVVDVAVRVGDVVETGALLLTIESMKLQTAIAATHPAQVAELCVAPGDHFDQGAPLVRLAAPDGAASVDTSTALGPPLDSRATPTPSPRSTDRSATKPISKQKPAPGPKSKPKPKSKPTRKPVPKPKKGRRA